MCGIIGYTGNNNAINIIENGLNLLEYRGYDSVGIAFNNENSIKCFKAIGDNAALFNSINKNNFFSSCAIGHCRWATCGKVTIENAHPQQYGKVVLVHNGIIENYKQLIEQFNIKDLKSETDSEVIAYLINYFYTNDPIKAIAYATRLLQGSYGLVIMFTDRKNCLYATRKISPLLFAENNDGIMIASELLPIGNNGYKYNYDLKETDILAIINHKFNIYDHNCQLKKYFPQPIKKEKIISKEKYKTFLEKEINQQPDVIDACLRYDINNFPNININEFERIYLIGCGTSYHASLIIKNNIQKYLNIDCQAIIASEFKESCPIINNKTLAICLSQSGETIDTVLAAQYAKDNNATVIALVNIENSLLVKLSDYHILSPAEREISVASTKAYSSQLMLLNMLIFYASKNEILIKNHLTKISKSIKLLLDNYQIDDELLEYICEHKIIFIGRGNDYLTLLEAALKIKELAYIDIDVYPAGELKHGPLAIIDDKCLVIGLCTQKDLYSKMLNNLREIKARGGQIILISNKQNKETEFKNINLSIEDEQFGYFTSIVYFQLLALKLATKKGYNVDKPRNLAKVVTVE